MMHMHFYLHLLMHLHLCSSPSRTAFVSGRYMCHVFFISPAKHSLYALTKCIPFAYPQLLQGPQNSAFPILSYIFPWKMQQKPTNCNWTSFSSISMGENLLHTPHILILFLRFFFVVFHQQSCNICYAAKVGGWGCFSNAGGGAGLVWTAALLQYNASFLLFVGCKKTATTTTSIENRKQNAERHSAGSGNPFVLLYFWTQK